MKTKNLKNLLPKTVVKEFHIDPEQGISCLVKFAPEGYLVQKIDRKNTKVTVTYELV